MQEAQDENKRLQCQVDEHRARAAELQQALDMQQEALKAEVQEGEQVVAQERTRMGHLEKSLVDANHSQGCTNLKVWPCCCAFDVPTSCGDGPADVTTSSEHVACLQDVLRCSVACIGSHLKHHLALQLCHVS